MYIVVFGTNSHVCGSYRGKTGSGGGGGGLFAPPSPSWRGLKTSYVGYIVSKIMDEKQVLGVTTQ